ncbi:MAG TPA: glycosyltransferase, partial [Solirubrobacteraceae bacterium]|nr:glycosyltransferase [Solirubrobacteraceae bacterium]
MALRIADAPAVPVPDRPRAERASAALNGGDWSAVSALWAEANALEDHHERYLALRELAEAGFAAPRGSAGALARRFLATGRGLLAALVVEPREPVLLNYAGIALYEIGELTGAAALFAAAERLAPGETAAASNRREIDRRRSACISVDRNVPAAVRAELGDLRRRATDIAAAARPATGMRLSLCMIVRDEEAHLGQCLASVQGVVDEMVVVDTGSTDRTKEIAESFGARVIDFPWTGSFSEARNVSFDAAGGDWLIYLDADEVLVAEDREALRELTGRTWREAFHLVETSYVGALESGAGVNHNALRVFRNRPQYRFEGRIHEQILPTLPTKLPERFERTGVRLEHYGYLGVVRDAKRKADRNIELLERQAQEGVDDAFQAFNLGSEYLALGRDEEARRHLDRAWRMVADDASGTHYPFAPVLVSRLVRARRGVGDAEAALRLIDEGLERFPGFTDLVLEHARIAQDRGDDATARERLERCLEMGDAPSGYTATMGSGTFVAMFELAELLRRQGDLAGAEELLRRSLREHPRFVQAVDPLAGVMLRRGASADAVVAEIGECVAEMTPGVRFILGMALYEAGLAQDAEPHFRA